MIRVLVADDSPTARALLVAILTSDPEIEVVGEAHHRAAAEERTHAPPPPEAGRAAARPPVRGRVVALAASTGGPAALHRLLSALPADFPVPLLAVQHITPGFVGGLADWLNKASGLRVKVAEDGEPLAPSAVYFAPDDRHLGVSPQAAVALARTPPVGGFRP